MAILRAGSEPRHPIPHRRNHGWRVVGGRVAGPPVFQVRRLVSDVALGFDERGIDPRTATGRGCGPDETILPEIIPPPVQWGGILDDTGTKICFVDYAS